jgi:hypothetical protein
MSPRVKAALAEGVTALVNIKTLMGLIVGAALGLSAYVRLPERVTSLENGRILDNARIEAHDHTLEALQRELADQRRYDRLSWCVDSVTVAGKNPRSCAQLLVSP